MKYLKNNNNIIDVSIKLTSVSISGPALFISNTTRGESGVCKCQITDITTYTDPNLVYTYSMLQ